MLHEYNTDRDNHDDTAWTDVGSWNRKTERLEGRVLWGAEEGDSMKVAL